MSGRLVERLVMLGAVLFALYVATQLAPYVLP